jgi:hypothetical protein
LVRDKAYSFLDPVDVESCADEPAEERKREQICDPREKMAPNVIFNPEKPIS